MDGQREDSEEDPDFIESDHDFESEHDDVEYERNVTTGVEIGLEGRQDEVQDEREEGNVNEFDELELPSTEELLSQGSSDEDDKYQFPEFSTDQDMKNPQFKVGQIFSSAVEFREAVRTYGAVNGYSVKFKANDERRVQGVCRLGCKWRIWASKFDASERLQVKSYTSDHNCSRDQFNRHCNYMFLTRRYLDQFKADPDWKTELILATVKKDLRTNISKNVAWKMRRYAKEVLVGNLQDQFRRLRSYAAEVLRTNVGSTVIIALQEHIFQGIYICFSCCKIGFRDGCRKVVGVDGCHLRGCFGGIMLTAVGLDANDCIYPVAYAVVQKENTAAWRWFFMHLSGDIEIGDGRGWTLMTDRQKGLQHVIDDLFPAAEHRFCVRHMYTNFFSAGFKSKTLKTYLWCAAKSTTIADYRHWMDQIRQLSEEAYKWLIERHPREWSRSHFSFNSKSDILLNNLCEVFNKTLRSDREKMILSMLTSLQLTFMDRIRKRRDTMMRCTGRLCTKIKKKLHKISEKSHECTLHLSGGPKWQVECSSGTYVVDLQERSCACRAWDLTGIPCMHAVAVIRECRNDPEDYVDNCYTIDTYLRCYSNIMQPINGMRLWPQLDMVDITPPSWTIPRKGRRQINRRKGADEEGIVHSQDKSYLRRKGRLTMTCSSCGLQGHNKRYHSRPDAPDADWLDGNLEPVESHRDIAVDERGKLVADKGQRSSTDDNSNNEQTFRFIPTPMVSREVRSRGLQTGPEALCTQSVPVDVPTDDVNFDDVVEDFNNLGEAETTAVIASRARKRRRAKGSTSAGT